MTVGRSVFAVAAVAAAGALLTAACGGEPPRTLQVFCWADYLDAESLADFERETGATVVVSNFSSNEEMAAKLRAGGGGFDLVCPTDYAVVQLAQDGLLAPLDPSKLPNARHLGDRFRAPAWDPSHAHSMPFQWGVTGIGFDGAKVKDPPRTWRDFFDAAKDGRHGKVSLLDDMREVLGAALLALGHSPNSRDAAEIAAARDLVVSVLPNVLRFDSDAPSTGLQTGETALAQGWSGQFAGGQRDLPTIAFHVPSEGAFTYVDNWAIPKGAPDADLAHRFIDWCLRPEVAASLVTKRLYASPNETARKLVDASIVAGIAYSDGGGAKLHWVEDAGPAGDLYAAAWRAIKSE